MITGGIKLSVREALESFPAFLGEFIKKRWLIIVLYVVVATSPAFIIGDQDVSDLDMGRRLQLGIIMLVNIVPSLLLIYYPIRDALFNLDSALIISNKSLAKALWTIFCVNIISAIVGIPLVLLFILPAIWWSTKASVAYANLISSNDGAIASIRKSHELMNGRFWQSLGFLVGTSSIVVIIALVAILSIGFFLLVGGLLNALFHEGAGINRLINLFRIIAPIISIFVATAFYYFQAWLYVYLKSQTSETKPATI